MARSIKGILDYLDQQLWSLGICSELQIAYGKSPMIKYASMKFRDL